MEYAKKLKYMSEVCKELSEELEITKLDEERREYIKICLCNIMYELRNIELEINVQIIDIEKSKQIK